MSIQFINSISHYTTQAQGNTKIAVSGTPSASQGAFGAYGMRSSSEQYNYTASATVEVSFYMKYQPVYGQWFRLRDGNNQQIWIDLQPDGAMTVYNGSRSTLLGSAPAGSIQSNVQNHVKIKVVHHASAGTVDIWVNGVSVLSLTGKNTAPSGTASSSNLQIDGQGGSNVSDGYHSHVVIGIASGDVVNTPRTTALFPNGNGTHADFTRTGGTVSGNYTAASETTPDDDTSYNAASSVGAMDDYTFQDLPTGTTGVQAVAITARLCKDDGTARTVAAFLRIGGVDYVHSTAKGVPASYAYLQWIWTLSPATGVAFTASEVNGMTAGIKIIS